MKKGRFDNLKTLLLTIALLLLTRMTDDLPWWFFVLPVTLLGVVVTLKNWDIFGFSVGFIAGFIIWFGASLYFDLTVNNIVLQRLGNLLYVPDFVVLLVSGIIGGLLTALALYTGKSMVAKTRPHVNF